MGNLYTQILPYFIFGLILGILFVYGITSLYRISWAKKDNSFEIVYNELVPLLNDYIFQPYINNVPVHEISIPIKKLKSIIKKSPYRRRVLIILLYKYMDLYSEQLDNYFISIYHKLDLYEDKLKDLNSSNYHKLIAAIDEYEYFEVKSKPVFQRIEKLRNSKNLYIREAVNYYLLKNSKYLISDVFNSLNYPLTIWERLQYFEIITERNFEIIPNFSQWINEETEPTLVMLCIDLAFYYNQSGTEFHMLGLVNTNNQLLKRKLDDCFEKLNNKTVLYKRHM